MDIYVRVCVSVFHVRLRAPANCKRVDHSTLCILQNEMDTIPLGEGFSIIESRDTVRDFAAMDYSEICNSIKVGRR